jgi:hypothetical protein
MWLRLILLQPKAKLKSLLRFVTIDSPMKGYSKFIAQIGQMPLPEFLPKPDVVLC